jgi:hypothetical protein
MHAQFAPRNLCAFVDSRCKTLYAAAQPSPVSRFPDYTLRGTFLALQTTVETRRLIMTTSHPLPAGQEQLVVALFSERAGAEQAIAALQQAGFRQDQIGAVVHQAQHTMTPQAEAALDQEAEATGTGVAVGSVAGSAAGIATGAALGSIGGPIGTILGGIVGAVAGVAAGAGIGEAIGERTAHTHHFGVPDERAQQYNTALQAGQIAVEVHARGVNEIMRARDVLSRFANEIDVYDRRSAPTNEGGSEASGEPGL